MSTTPTIVFSANLALKTQETFGPIGNSREVAVLSPDRFTSNQTSAVSTIALRGTQRLAWLPDKMRDNKYLSNGQTFTLVGEDALYVRNTYGIGYADPRNAILTVVSQTN